MSELFLLTDAQMARLETFSPRHKASFASIVEMC